MVLSFVVNFIYLEVYFFHLRSLGKELVFAFLFQTLKLLKERSQKVLDGRKHSFFTDQPGNFQVLQDYVSGSFLHICSDLLTEEFESIVVFFAY